MGGFSNEGSALTGPFSYLQGTAVNWSFLGFNLIFLVLTYLSKMNEWLKQGSAFRSDYPIYRLDSSTCHKFICMQLKKQAKILPLLQLCVIINPLLSNRKRPLSHHVPQRNYINHQHVNFVVSPGILSLLQNMWTSQQKEQSEESASNRTRLEGAITLKIHTHVLFIKMVAKL